MEYLQSQMTLISLDDSGDNNDHDCETTKNFQEDNKTISDGSENDTTFFGLSRVQSSTSLSCSNFHSFKSVSFLEQGIFARLFYDEQIFREKSGSLKLLAAEIQDISNMSSTEKELFVKHFKKIPKSNIYKNIFRCFNRFMSNSNNHISIECLDTRGKDISTIRKQFQKFLKKVSYPEMIYRIMKNERYSKFFYYYLQGFFLDDLCTGNFKQLRDHFISSIYFITCSQDPSLFDNIKFHKK